MSPGYDKPPAGCSHDYPWGAMRCARCGHQMGHGTWLLRLTQQVRDDYLDGEPLSPADRRLVLVILRRQPEGRRKFGDGIRDVFVHPYVGGHRCFWVVHPEGSVEDFSIRRALGRQLPRTPKVAAAMEMFDTAKVAAAYRRQRARLAERAVAM